MKTRMKRHAVIQPLDTSYRLIPLTQGQNTIVDAADFEWLSQFNWFASWDKHTKGFYAVCNFSNRRLVSMHALILDCKSGEQSDHKNHDTLDNRRENLRKCSAAQNSSNRKIRSDNTSGYKGVYWDKYYLKWRAEITSNGKRTQIGLFDNLKEAALAYDEACKIYHGDFSYRNFS